MEKLGANPFGSIQIPTFVEGQDDGKKFIIQLAMNLVQINHIKEQGSHIEWVNNKCNKLRELKTRVKEFKSQTQDSRILANADELIRDIKGTIDKTGEVHKTVSSFISATVNGFHMEKAEGADNITPAQVKKGILNRFKTDHNQLFQVCYHIMQIFNKKILEMQQELTESQNRAQRAELDKSITEHVQGIGFVRRFLDREIPPDERKSLMKRLDKKKEKTGSENKEGIANFTEELVAFFRKEDETEVVDYLRKSSSLPELVNSLASLLEDRLLSDMNTQKAMDVLSRWPMECNLSLDKRKKKVEELMKSSKEYQKLNLEYSKIIYQYLLNFFDPSGEIRFDLVSQKCKKNGVELALQMGEVVSDLRAFGRETNGLLDKVNRFVAGLRQDQGGAKFLNVLENSVRTFPGSLMAPSSEALKTSRNTLVKSLVEVLKFKSAKLLLDINFLEFCGPDETYKKAMRGFESFLDGFSDWLELEIDEAEDDQKKQNVFYFFVLSALQLLNDGDENLGIAIFNTLDGKNFRDKKQGSTVFKDVVASKAFQDLRVRVAKYSKNLAILQKEEALLKKKSAILFVPNPFLFRQSFSLTSDQLDAFNLNMRGRIEGLPADSQEALYRKIHAYANGPAGEDQVLWGKKNLFSSWRYLFQCLEEIKAPQAMIDGLEVVRGEWIQTKWVITKWQDDYLARISALQIFYSGMNLDSFSTEFPKALSEIEKNAHYRVHLKNVLFKSSWLDENVELRGMCRRSGNQGLLDSLIQTAVASIDSRSIDFATMGFRMLTVFDDEDASSPIVKCNKFVGDLRFELSQKNVRLYLRRPEPEDRKVVEMWKDEFEKCCLLLFFAAEIEKRGCLQTPLARSLIEDDKCPLDAKLRDDLRKALDKE